MNKIGRPGRTKAEKRAIVKTWYSLKNAGVTREQFCETRDFGIESLGNWCREFPGLKLREVPFQYSPTKKVNKMKKKSFKLINTQPGLVKGMDMNKQYFKSILKKLTADQKKLLKKSVEEKVKELQQSKGATQEELTKVFNQMIREKQRKIA